MRFNIQKLREAGFEVVIDKEAVTIVGAPIQQQVWENIKDIVSKGVHDPGLRDYVAGTFFDSLSRAQILELAE